MIFIVMEMRTVVYEACGLLAGLRESTTCTLSPPLISFL